MHTEIIITNSYINRVLRQAEYYWTGIWCGDNKVLKIKEKSYQCSRELKGKESKSNVKVC